MITGFFTFVIWLLFTYFWIMYVFEDSQCKTIWKILGVIAIDGFGFFLIWLFVCHWEWLAMGLLVIFFIYLAIQGLFGPL